MPIDTGANVSTEETKVFTIRFVPLTMHKKWKIFANLLDISMEEFAMQAINEKIEREYVNKIASAVNSGEDNKSNKG